MKRLLFFSLSLFITAAAIAVPAKRGQWKTLRLADGTEVKAELVGDEYGHYYRTAVGQCYVKDFDGSTTHGVNVYKSADLAELQSNIVSARAKAAQKQSASPSKVMRTTIGGSHSEFSGTKKGLIILVQFSDKSFASGHDKTFYSRMANEEGFNEGNFKGSVHDYYYAQSGGKFTIDFDVIGPITMPKSYSYYGADYSSYIKDYHVTDMITTALKQADSEVNYADYDWDGDGLVEQVFILYAGRGQATSDDENTIWPHMSQLGSYGITLDGTRLNTYACSNEMRSDTEIDGIGTICHEFSHCMGLPDLYDTSDSGNFGMSAWSLMDQGCYLDDSFCPCGYTAYERMYCGWLEPTELTDGMEVGDMAAISDGGGTYILHNSGNSNEYYLFENRQLKGWDSALYGTGLLVTHVDFNSSVWANNLVNTISAGQNDHKRCTILHADNAEAVSASGLEGDTYPYVSNKNITKATTQRMALYTANADGDTIMNLALTDIRESDAGTISFKVTTNDKIGKENKPENALFYESFDFCNGGGGNDGLWSYTVNDAGNFTADNEGWTSDWKSGGDMCARFGTASRRGTVTSPSIDIDGTAILSFKAAPWTGGGNKLAVSLDNSEITQSDKLFTMESDQWNEYMVTLTGTGSVKITFTCSQKSFFLDEVAVVPDTGTGISEITANGATAKQCVYTIDGRYVGKSLDGLKKGIYIMGGKKIVK